MWSERRAWRYLQTRFEKAEEIDDPPFKAGVKILGDEHVCLCDALMILTDQGKITHQREDEMKAKIFQYHNTRHNHVFLWPTTLRGMQSRAKFCARMVKMLEKKS